MKTLEQVKKIKEKYEKQKLEIENVIGVGIGKKKDTQELCIRVYVRKRIPESQLKPGEIVPESIEGIQIDVVESGEIRFQHEK